MRKNKSLQVSLTILLMFLLLLTNAEPIDTVTLKQLATNFYTHLASPAQPSQREAGQIVKSYYVQLESTDLQRSSTVACFHIVNFRGGFVIIAADDRVEPILAYSTESSFIAENIPDNVAAWLDNYQQEISYILSHDTSASNNVNEQWFQLKHNNIQTQRTSVGPLLQTTYNQGTYYNQYCPATAAGPNGHAWAGCVAAAMAQIIRYWEYPTQGVGSHSYVANFSSYGYGNFGTLAANFGNTTYNYALMPNYLSSTSTTAEINEVARLTYHCGISVDMMYGASSSGAYSAYVPNALQNYFAYPSGITYVSRSNYPSNNWYALIRGELNNARPVFYDGNGNGGGHAFVCDGYEGNYFHFNWGWGGSYNGNFQLGALNPGSHNFTSNQGAVVGITVANPTILHFPNKLSILALVGGNGNTECFEVRGIALTDSILVSASPHFKVGTSSDSFYSQISIPENGGTLFIQYVPVSSHATTEQGTIILSSGNISDTIPIFATASTPVCTAPTQLNAYPVYHGINLSWTAPEEHPEIHTSTLSWDSTLYTSLNLGTNITYCMLHRYDVNDLAPYQQSFIKAISFIPCTEAVSYRLVVYQGGNYTNNQYNPGEQVVNQEVPLSQLNNGTWNTVYLMNPILVDGTKELWFGIIAYTNNYEEITRLGSASYRANKGSVVGYYTGPYTDSTAFNWTDLSAWRNLPYNFTLKGIFESVSGHVTEYEVFRNDSLLGITTDTRYADINLSPDSTEYAVYAVWDNNCNAGTSVKALADTNLTPCTITINMHAEQGNGWYGNRVRVYQRGDIQEFGFHYGQDSSALIDVYDGPIELEWVADTLPHTCSFNLLGPCLYYESPNNPSEGVFLSLTINCDAAQISTPDFTYSTASACDSTNVSFFYSPQADDAHITIQFGDGENSTIDLSNSSVDSIVFDHSYRISGNYEVVLSVEKENCDIIRSASKTIGIENVYNTLGIDTLYINACDSCVWNNTTYYESTSQLFRFDNSQGCDSLVMLYITINKTDTFDFSLDTCESFTWDDSTYYESGDYTRFYTNTNGCDSIVTLHLTILHGTHNTETAIACDSYEWHDSTYTETGTYMYHYTNEDGCASVDTLELIINYGTSGIDEQEACDSYTWIDDVIYTESTNTPTITLTNANGCDSIVTLHLTIKQSVFTSDFLTINEDELPYTYADTIFGIGTPAISDYTFHYTTIDGCDSTVTLHLTINNVGINSVAGKDYHFNAYPNPVNDIVNVHFSSLNKQLENAEIQLFDIFGRKLHTTAVNDEETQLDLSNYANGLYLIRLYDKQELIGVVKVVKRK